MAQNPVSPGIPGRSQDFNPGQRNADKSNTEAAAQSSLVELYDTDYPSGSGSSNFALRSEPYLENGNYSVEGARLFADSDEEDSITDVYVPDRQSARLGPVYNNPREDSFLRGSEPPRSWREPAGYFCPPPPSRYRQYHSRIPPPPCHRLQDAHFRDPAYAFSAHPNFVHSHSLLDEFGPPPQSSSSSSDSSFEPGGQGRPCISFPPPPRLRRAVMPRTLETCVSPVPYHQRNNIDAYDIEAYGLDEPPLQRVDRSSPPPPTGEFGSAGYSAAGTSGLNTRNIQEHLGRAVSVRNASTSTPPNLEYMQQAESSKSSAAAAGRLQQDANRKKRTSDAPTEATNPKLKRHEKAALRDNREGSGFTAEVAEASNIVDDAPSSATNLVRQLSTSSSSSSSTSSSSNSDAEIVEQPPPKRTEPLGRTSSTEIEVAASTLAPSSKNASRSNSNRASPNLSPAYSQEALRDLVCATLAPAAAANLMKNDKRDKDVKRKASSEIECQAGPSGGIPTASSKASCSNISSSRRTKTETSSSSTRTPESRKSSSLRASPSIPQEGDRNSNSAPPTQPSYTTTAGPRATSVTGKDKEQGSRVKDEEDKHVAGPSRRRRLSEEEAGPSGVRRRMSGEAGPSGLRQADSKGGLTAPDLQLDCLSSDSDDSSSDDVQVW